jgi:hypothetical protein
MEGRYGGMKASEAKRLRELEAENARLKRLVANQALDIDQPPASPTEDAPGDAAQAGSQLHLLARAGRSGRRCVARCWPQRGRRDAGTPRSGPAGV